MANAEIEKYIETSDAEIDAAMERGRKFAAENPHVTSIDYSEDLDLVIIHMSNGLRLPVPVENFEGLEHATPAQIRNYELHGLGYGFGFPDLDADFYLPALLKGISGFPKWMGALGKGEASARSEAKRAAYRRGLRQPGEHAAA